MEERGAFLRGAGRAPPLRHRWGGAGCMKEDVVPWMKGGPS